VRSAVLGVLALVVLCGVVSAASVRVDVHFVGSGTVVDSAAFYDGDEAIVTAYSKTSGINMDYKLAEWLNVDEEKGSKSITVTADALDFYAAITVLGGTTMVSIHSASDASLKYSAFGSHDEKFTRSVSFEASEVKEIQAGESYLHVFRATGDFHDVVFTESFLASLADSKITGNTKFDVPAGDEATFSGVLYDVVTVPYEISDVKVVVNVDSLDEDNVVVVDYVNDNGMETVTTTIDGLFAGLDDTTFFYENFGFEVKFEIAS